MKKKCDECHVYGVEVYKVTDRYKCVGCLIEDAEMFQEMMDDMERWINNWSHRRSKK